MGVLETLVSGLGLSFVSGINLYATLLVLGLGQRFGILQNLPEDLAILANPWVLAAATTFYLLEFFADKIPFVNNIWDGFHTFVRPLGAALLALGATQDLGTVAQIIAMFVGGGVALGSHSTKSSFRLLANATPEPVTQSVISVAEDVGVVGILALTYSYPLIALGVLLVLIVGMAIVTPLLFRTIRLLARSVWGFVRRASGFGPADAPFWLQREIDDLKLNGKARFAPGFARSVRRVATLRSGWVVWNNEESHFVHRPWFTTRSVKLSEGGIPDFALERSMAFDVLHLEDTGGKDRRIYLPKDASATFGVWMDRPQASVEIETSAG